MASAVVDHTDRSELADAEDAARSASESNPSLGDLWAAVGTEWAQLQHHLWMFLQIRADQVRTTVQGLFLLAMLLAGVLLTTAVMLATAAILLMVGIAEGLTVGLDWPRWASYSSLGGGTLLVVFIGGWAIARGVARRQLLTMREKYDSRPF